MKFDESKNITRRCIVAVAMLLLLFSCGLAQAAALDVSVLGELNAPDFSVRENATYRLLADESITPEAIIPLYRAATTPEQRLRLLTVAQHHFIRRLWCEEPIKSGANGSIGIGHQSLSGDSDNEEIKPRAAVRVTHALPGFPGAVFLRSGDIILAINGKPLPQAQAGRMIEDTFRETVMTLRAGSKIRLSITRDDQPMEVEFALAPVDALRRVYVSANTLSSECQEKWNAFVAQLQAVVP